MQLLLSFFCHFFVKNLHRTVLFLAGPLVPVENSTVTVNEEGDSVNITWLYNGDLGIPVTVLITILNSESRMEVFSRTVPVEQNSLEVPRGDFGFNKLVVVFTTMNELEPGQTSNATFFFFENLPTTTSASKLESHCWPIRIIICSTVLLLRNFCNSSHS